MHKLTQLSEKEQNFRIQWSVAALKIWSQIKLSVSHVIVDKPKIF